MADHHDVGQSEAEEGLVGSELGPDQVLLTSTRSKSVFADALSETREMLQHGPDAAVVEAADLGRGHGADHVRIGREASVQGADRRVLRIHIDVHDGRQVEVDAGRPHRPAHRTAGGARDGRVIRPADRRLALRRREASRGTESGDTATLLIDGDEHRLAGKAADGRGQLRQLVRRLDVADAARGLVAIEQDHAAQAGSQGVMDGVIRSDGQPDGTRRTTIRAALAAMAARSSLADATDDALGAGDPLSVDAGGDVEEAGRVEGTLDPPSDGRASFLGRQPATPTITLPTSPATNERRSSVGSGTDAAYERSDEVARDPFVPGALEEALAVEVDGEVDGEIEESTSLVWTLSAWISMRRPPSVQR